MSGCAVAPVYQPDPSQPSASLKFTSPYREDTFMVVERLALLVFQRNARCDLTLKGRISLAGKLVDKSWVAVPAGRPLLLRLWEADSDYIALSSRKASRSISFVPQIGQRYELRHIDSPGTIRAELYQHVAGAEPVSVALERWPACAPG